MNSAKTNISDLFNTESGTVCIFGAGPSLLYLDSRRFVGKECIYVNSSVMTMPENSENCIWLSVDRLSLKWSWFDDFVLKRNCRRIVSKDFLKYQDLLSKYNFRYFNITKVINGTDLCGVSSVPAAVDLAIKMGYRKILLFGIDHRFIQGKSHFWEFYPKDKRPVFSGGTNVGKKEQEDKFSENIAYFMELKNIAQERRIKIFNCSKRTSNIDIFEKMELEEAYGSID